VALLVVVPESVPPPLTVQVTPALFWSLLTVALSVVVSPPSTVLAAAVTETPTAGEPPPHPAIHRDAARPRQAREARSGRTTATIFQNIQSLQKDVLTPYRYCGRTDATEIRRDGAFSSDWFRFRDAHHELGCFSICDSNFMPRCWGKSYTCAVA
jgi:hypothetical protein